MKFKLIPIMALAAASTLFAASMPTHHAMRDQKGRLSIWGPAAVRTTEVSHAAATPSAENPVQRDGKGRLSIWNQISTPQAVHHATARHTPATPAEHVRPDAKGRLSVWSQV